MEILQEMNAVSLFVPDPVDSSPPSVAPLRWVVSSFLPLGMRCRSHMALLLLLWPTTVTVADAQDLIPGAYTPAPVGINVITTTATFNKGDIAFDTASPIEDAHATIGVGSVAFNRTLNIAGRYASLGIGLPYLHGHLTGTVLGNHEERTRSGQGDLLGRVAINLYGAPAMTRQEFAGYRGATNLGVSLVVTAPVGQYVPTQYINVGSNRWLFRPEVGFTRRRGRWTFEGDLATSFFTDNTNYVGTVRHQAPIVAVQGHLIYTFRPALWIAGDANYWKGGRVTTSDTTALLEQKNSRAGITLAVPIHRQQVRIAYSFGARTTIGGDFHSLGVSYSYAWAAR
jgi:hypothetical protein